jgi:phage terminase Nu1 subunit (DNA packaging protein)
VTESITQAQAAEIVGVTSRRLRQLESEDAAPPRGSDGTYPATEFGKWIRARLMSELGVANDGKAYDYEAERARLTKAQADKTELEVAELRADLVRGAIVEQHWQAMVSAMRAKLVGLPSKIAPQVSGPDSLNRVQDLIQGVVFEALAEIAGDAFPDEIRKRLDAQSHDNDNGASSATVQADNHPVGKRAPATKRGGQRGAGAVPK